MNRAKDYVLNMIMRRDEQLRAKISKIKEKYPEDMYGLKWEEKAGKYIDELGGLREIYTSLHSGIGMADRYKELYSRQSTLNEYLIKELNKYDPHTVQTLRRRFRAFGGEA